MSSSPVGDFLSPLSFQDPPVITPSGWLEHGPFAAWIVGAVEPRLLVELGTHWGYSFFAFCEAVKARGLDTRCVAVDTWEGDEHAGFYGQEVHDFVHDIVTRDYSPNATMLRQRFDEAVDSFDDGSIDLLHIDGRHRYEDAVEDFNTYLPKLSQSAVVLMHDIVVRDRGFGVWRHWEELRQQYPTFEFHHGHGLGVVAVGPDIPAAIARLTSLDSATSEADAVRQAYHRLGGAISRAAELGVADEQRRELETQLETARTAHSEDIASALRQAQGREHSLRQTVRGLEADLRRSQHLTPGLLRQLTRERLRTEGVRLLKSDEPDEMTRKRLADLFDPEYYARQHPELEAGRANFAHYVQHGWPAGESPTPLFDPGWYLAVHTDIAASGFPPLLHYLLHGDAEGRDPNAVFDTSWYRQKHGSTFLDRDLALTHFAREGTRRSLDPSPAFLTKWYLEQYPDVAESGRNALADYLLDGALRGRDPHPHFDTSWYVDAHTDICRDGTNPLVHYLTFGLSEDRATNAAGAHHCRN